MPYSTLEGHSATVCCIGAICVPIGKERASLLMRMLCTLCTQTGGAGVHLALNSLADDKLQVSNVLSTVHT